METYESLEKKIGGKRRYKKIAPNTVAHRVSAGVSILFHATPIVHFWGDGRVVVSAGGYKTRTTKERINRYCSDRYSIMQRKHKWYWVKNRDHKIVAEFTNQDYFDSIGELIAQVPITERNDQ